MRKSSALLAYLLVNLSTLLWASNITLGRALRGQVGPLTLTAVRVTVAGLLFLALIRRLPPAERRPGRDWPWLLGMALTGVFAFPVLLYFALRFTTASNASLINGAGPLVTAVLAAALLRERLRSHQALGAVVSLAGVFLYHRRRRADDGGADAQRGRPADGGERGAVEPLLGAGAGGHAGTQRDLGDRVLDLAGAAVPLPGHAERMALGASRADPRAGADNALHRRLPGVHRVPGLE